MNHIYALLILAQNPVPPEVTAEALKGFNEGGFKAVAIVLAVGLVASWVVAWRMLAAKDVIIATERAASRELTQSMKVDSIGATQTYGKIETTLGMSNQALVGLAESNKTMATEIRILGDRVRDLERARGVA
jgi:hypothetical protein